MTNHHSLKMEKTSSVDFLQVKADSELFLKGVQGQILDDFVLVLGGNRSGKKTLLNILAGKPIEILRINGKYVVDLVGKDYVGGIDSKGFEKMLINHGRHAGAKFPNCVNIEGVQFWTCPGGYDQSIDEEIAKALCVQTLLSHAAVRKGCKIVIVQDHDGVSVEGGKSFKDSIALLCKIFQPKSDHIFENLIDATTFVFTKVPDDALCAEDCSPELYLTNIIADLTTNQSKEELLRRPYEVQACAEFIEVMLKKKEQIRHIEVPRVSARVTDVAVVLDPVVCGDKGLFAKVSSCSNFCGQPVVALVKEANLEVLDHAVTLRQQMQQSCITLTALLKEMWSVFEVKEGAPKTENEIAELLQILKERKIEAKDGGASILSLELINAMKRYVAYSGDPFEELLRNLEHVIEGISFTEKFHRDKTCGAYFTDITSSIIVSAEKYLDESQRSELLKSQEALKEYLEACDRAWWNGVQELARGGFHVGVGAVSLVSNQLNGPMAGIGNVAAGENIIRGLRTMSNASFKPGGSVPKEPRGTPSKVQNLIDECLKV